MPYARKNKYSTPPNSRRPRPKRDITPEYLQKSALYYLQRYASSRDNLRRVMMRKLQRAGVDRDNAKIVMLDQLLCQLTNQGLINDHNYAWARIQTLSGAGKSWRKIESHLQSKGVSRDDIARAKTQIECDQPDREWQSAMAFARRKKIGPFRKCETADPERELRQLAAAGFSYSMAKKIVGHSIDERDDKDNNHDHDYNV